MPCIFSLFLLWGCSSVPPQPQSAVNWQTYQQQLKQLTHFTLKGKLAYISPQDRVSLNLYWKQEGDSYELNLSSFLGGNILNLKVTPQGAVLIDDRDSVYHGTSANRLIFHLTGLYVPADQMKNWIKGLPTGADRYQLSALNRLASLNKDQSWQVNYRAYQMVDKLALPQNIQLQQEKTKIKVIIDSWEIE